MRRTQPVRCAHRAALRVPLQFMKFTAIFVTIKTIVTLSCVVRCVCVWLQVCNDPPS